MTHIGPGQKGDALVRLLAHASIEVTPRQPAAIETLHEHFAPGTDVNVTFLPDDDLAETQAACRRLREKGFNPTPHLTARNFVSLEMLEGHLAKMQSEAKVTRALCIAGDVAEPRGPFAMTSQLIGTGLLPKYGIEHILIAGHPEGHPHADQDTLDAALETKIAQAREQGLGVEIVTQFGFEAEPVVAWMRRLRARGIDVPIRIGVAGPASTASLLRFAVRCGVGNSVRVLRKRAPAIGKLLGDTNPSGLLGELADEFEKEDLGPVCGIHLYIFGGMKKTADWLNAARRDAALAAQPADQNRSTGL